MRCDSFARSLTFAIVAAVLWTPCTLLIAPLLGWRSGTALCLVALTALYTLAIAPPRAPRLRVTALVGSAALLVATLAPHGGELVLGLAAILGLARSAFLYPRAPARALTIEIVLLAGGLLFAHFLSGPGLFASTLALWGFLLVQSVFFLIGDTPTAARATPRADPFDDAHRRAAALLDG